YIDNHEANLYDLFDCFDQFVESLKNKYTILNKLPTDSYPIKSDIKRGKSVDGEEYCILFNTDINIWIKEFEIFTGATYNKRKTEHIEKNNTTRIIYQCHHA
ncbi:33560_t:CDS:1, partial [Racocetra persica]